MMTLMGSQNYNGPTTVASGVLKLGSVTSGGGGSTISVVNAPQAVSFGTTSPATINGITVGSQANVLVVDVSTDGVQNVATDGFALTYGGKSLTLAVQTPSNVTGYRNSAIYYLYNPPATGTLTATMPNIAAYIIDAFTLGGVSTTSGIVTGGIDAGAVTKASVTLNGIQAGSVRGHRSNGAHREQRAFRIFGHQ